MVVYSTRRQMSPCNLFSEQALVFSGREGEENQINKSKLTDQSSTKVTESSKGVKCSIRASTNGSMERNGEDFDSWKQQMPLLGWHSNDTAVTVPIKKRKIQMAEIIRSPSPPSISMSPVNVLQSPSRCHSPACKGGMHNMTNSLADGPWNDDSINTAKFGEPTEGDCSAESLEPNLDIKKLTENVTLEDKNMANVSLLDKPTVPIKGEHASCLEVVVNKSVDGNFAELSDYRIDPIDTSSQKADDRVVPLESSDRGALLESSSGVAQKNKLPLNGTSIKAGSRPVDGVFAKLSYFRVDHTDAWAQEAGDRAVSLESFDRGVLLESSGGVPQKSELPTNDVGIKAGMLSSLVIEKLLQNEECQLKLSDDRGACSKLTSWFNHDERLNWDLNRDMGAWEHASDEKLCADSLRSNMYDISQSVDSFSHQSLWGKSQANSENTVDEAIPKNDLSVLCDGQSEGNEMEPAYVAESFEYDAYDEEDEPVSDTDKQPSAYIDEELAGNEHQRFITFAGDGGEELEVEEHVDYDDSDCREADDMALEGDENLSLTLQSESDWKFEEVNGTAELHTSHNCARIEGDFSLRRSYPHILNDLCGVNIDMMEEDGEVLPQFNGSGLLVSDNQHIDCGEIRESPRRVLRKEQEYEAEKALQLGEPNTCSKDLSDKSNVQHEMDNQPGFFQRYVGQCKPKSTGWDQLPEGFHTVEDALKAVKENTSCQRAIASWTVRSGSSYISSQGLLADGWLGSGTQRNASSREGGSMGDRSRPCGLAHGRGNSSHRRRFGGAIDPALRFLSSREAVHGKRLGRGLAGAGRFRVDPWMDCPGGQCGPENRRSLGHYTRSNGPSSRGPTNSTSLVAAKIQGSGFVVAPDGTIVKARNMGCMGRSGILTSVISSSDTMPIRGPSIDHDAGLDFHSRISMPFHHSTGPRSKLVRQTPSPPRNEDRSSDQDCKRLMSRVYTTSRRTPPHVTHGTALIDDRGRRSIDVNWRISPTMSKQSEQTGKHPLQFIGRSMDDDLDNRRFKRDYDDTGRFSSSYRRFSLKSACCMGRGRSPTFDYQREQSRGDEKRERILNRNVRHISGFRHISIRNFDDDIAPKFLRPS